ncbi:MAG: DUF4342 domain-containing protein [Bacillota bacterium]|nr:DUF4342 domain-containing protein [Bacillota bacterium]
MEITLEKIELVKDRTGVTYAEAKQALEDADGSVVDAIISIEETVNSGEKGRGFGEKGEALFTSLKELVKKGNVAKIQVKRADDTILNIPVNAGILGICIAPLASVVALVAAFGFKCTIEVIKTDGTIIDVSDAVSDTVATVAEKGSDKADFLKEKGKEYYEKAMKSDFVEKAKENEFMDKAVDGVSDFVEKAGEFADDIAEKIKKNDVAEKAEEAAEEVAEEVSEAAEEVAEEVEEKVNDEE